MKHLETNFEPKFWLRFTEKEIALMLMCSERHYDGVCKSAAQIGGFLYGLKNRAETGRPEREFRWRELDTLCKILEISSYLPEPERSEGSRLFDELLWVLQSYKAPATVRKALREAEGGDSAPDNAPGH